MLEKEYFMRIALKEAEIAYKEGEVPIGAVIEYKGKVIAKAHNQVERLNDPTAHAEILAITQASNFLGNWRLNNCSLYVTIEPCMMCMGAIILARVPFLCFGAHDIKFGAVNSLINIGEVKGLNHHPKIEKGVLEAECREIMGKFFKNLR